MDHEDCRAADEANGLKALVVGVGGLTGRRQGALNIWIAVEKSIL
jgi:hypothetical protein